MIQWIHPTVVHFAIGLLLAGLAFDVVGLLRINEKLLFAGFWNTIVGAVAVVIAVITGLSAEAQLGPHSKIGDSLLSFHKLFGLVELVVVAALVAGRVAMKGYIWPKARIPYLTLAFLAASIIGITGIFGGVLVYAYGIGLPPETARRIVEAQPDATPYIKGIVQKQHAADAGPVAIIPPDAGPVAIVSPDAGP